MAGIGEEHAAVEDEKSPFDRRVFRALLDIAKQYKRQFIIVSLFSFLYTGLDLLQPLVYRAAINAVAGMFVTQAPGAGTRLAVVAAQSPQQTFAHC
jgi:ABC-type multidrug transport system fused ATPase/permease subunit